MNSSDLLSIRRKKKHAQNALGLIAVIFEVIINTLSYLKYIIILSWITHKVV